MCGNRARISKILIKRNFLRVFVSLLFRDFSFLQKCRNSAHDEIKESFLKKLERILEVLINETS